MEYVGYVLFPFAVAFMIYVTVNYGRAIKTSGLPGQWTTGSPNRWWNVPWWIEGKWFCLWRLFGVNVIVGLAVLLGTIRPSGKIPHPALWLIAYAVIGPWVHWFNTRRLYEWSLKQDR
jgi:hypothetical protein